MLRIVCFHFIINDKIHTTLLLWSVVHVSQQRYVSLYISEKKYLSEIVLLHTVYQINGPIHIYILQNASMDSTL